MSQRGVLRSALALLLLSLIAACSRSSEDQQAKSAQAHRGAAPAAPMGAGAAHLDAEAVAQNNRGVGLMGRFEYEKARKVFAALVERYPHREDLKVNLAIALLNRQEEGDEKAALALVDAVIARDPHQLRAQYVAGLLRLYLSSPADALPHFKAVAQGDPKDAYAAYYLGQCLSQQGDRAQALVWYRKALKLDPYLRSAYYGAFQMLQHLGQREQARAMAGDYQRLGNSPQARLAEFKYTRMGPKALALAMSQATPTPVVLPHGPVFLDPKPLSIAGADTLSWSTLPAARARSITAADVNGDGRLDLFLAGALDGEHQHNLVLLGQADGTFVPVLDNPLSAVSDVNAALWGDFDNDGRADVYLCRLGPNQLWHQTASGGWENVTATTGTAGGDADTVDGAFFDADHDGDLDLFLVNADARNELLNNNLDGTFRPLAAERGIAGDGTGAREVLPVDLDGDRDADLVVIKETPPHEIYLNDRLWKYHPAPGMQRFRSTPILAAVAGDLDADGRAEIYTLGEDGKLLRWQPDGKGDLEPFPVGSVAEGSSWGQLALADVDGDGTLDLVVAGPFGWSAWNPLGDEAGEMFDAPVEAGDSLAALAPVLLDPASGPAVIAQGQEHPPWLWAPGSGRADYVAMRFTGAEDAGKSMRSNASGIGTRVALRVDSRWSIASTLRPRSGPGQDLQPVALGLGGAKQADFAAIDWSDGVFQSELDLTAGKLHTIAETQRQLSSCPVLFAWDGRRFAFVSDLLGVGGLGYATGPGEYAPARPWENLLLPAGLLQPRGGRYVLKLTEPMEEAAYLDSARLVAYDLPPGWDLVLDERMGVEKPAPTGQARFYRHEVLPDRAVDQAGHEVTAAIARADGNAAPPGPLDHRFIGRLAGEHVLTLEFAHPLDTEAGHPLLVADGWVEYPYSQTMFAAWQAGAAYEAPTLEARGTDGKWRTLLAHFGYPAGMPRRMSVPLEGLPAGTTALRLRSNMEIYWDRIAVAYAEPLPQARRETLPLRLARVEQAGFPRRIAHPQHRPDFDYSRRSPFWDTRYMAGNYTRLGRADELVAAADDALAIIGPGEEVRLEFAAPQAGPAPGWTRRLVLETNGWTKDMDLYTKDGETLGPLPNSGKDPARRAELDARYNTRWMDGR